MPDNVALEEGRKAFRLRRWTEAFEHLTLAGGSADLDPDDLDLLGTAAILIGKNEEGMEAFVRAHHRHLEHSRPDLAVMSAFRIGFQLMNSDDVAQAGAWLSRAQRVLEESGVDCVGRGYLLFPVGTMTMFGGDAAAAQPIFEEMGSYARRFGDKDLMALSLLCEGECLIMLGRAAEGVALHDEAMLSVTSGEVSPMIAGLIYCAVLQSCQQIFDLRRAHEWTEALTRFCASQPDLVPYRGQCLVHRAEIMQLRGSWPDALQEAERAREVLSRPPPQAAVGDAFYQLGEIYRLRGAFAEAEEAYRRANEFGRTPQPGMAALRLAQGQTETAGATIRRVLEETQDRGLRCKVLAVSVDIMIEAGDTAGARDAAGELAEIAKSLETPYLRAISDQATGAALLAEGEAHGALAPLRSAAAAWHSFEAPYEAALTRVLIGLACRHLGDTDTATLELDAARQTFARLGAAPALARLDELEGKDDRKAPGGLTAREIEVLRLVASGKTNRGIANELVLSEKTIARHISNIFTKLGVATRAAATAFAYEHDLV